MGGAAFDEKSLFAALPHATNANRVEGKARLAASGGGVSQLGGGTGSPFRGQRSACGDFASLQFEPLPATTQEVDEIVTIWNRGASTSLERSKGGSGAVAEVRPTATRLIGAQATETAFKHNSPGTRVLHLSTHGFFLDGRCPSALAGQRGIGMVDTESGADEPPVGENPLVLTGLAFAGANHRLEAAADEDDGILTAQEIATLDLRGVEWAVLSACETGRGEIRSGEGVFGLRRSFQVAGARTVIMSLWPVDDEATRQWMKVLYHARLSRGLGTAEAVYATSLDMLQQRRSAGKTTHPFTWAAFVAAGDWR